MGRVFIPENLESLWEVLEREPASVIYAGGTDLLVRLGHTFRSLPSLVCLERIGELKGAEDHGDRVLIRAGSTHTHLLANPILRREFPVLIKALQVLGSPPIRNMGTIGGNLCTASPAGDTLPALTVLGAEVEIGSSAGFRRIPLKDFIQGPGKTSLQAREIVCGVWVKKNPDWTIHHYEKAGQRRAMAISIASLAGLLKVSGSGVIERARFAWGSVGPAVITSDELEGGLVRRPLSRQTLEEAASLARQLVSPIDDVRATAEYRREVSGNLLLRLLDYSHGSARIE
jgi:xanthine dehydrogenase FAD-binding subunit